MTLKRSDKTKVLFRELLGNLGWASVYSDQSGVFMKNNIYFVLYPSEVTPLYRTYAINNLKTGIELPIHNKEAKWILTKDGFLLDSGNLPKFLSDAYDYGLKSDFGEKTKDFVAGIDRVTGMSELELLTLKYKEKVVGNDTERYVLSVSKKPLQETNMFITNHKVCPGVLDYFKAGVAYNVTGYINNKFIVAPSSQDLISIKEGQDIKISLEEFEKLGKAGGIIPVELKNSVETVKVYEFEKITDTTATGIGDTFADFGLDAAQLSCVSAAIAKGLNFTPLLNNSLSAEQDALILEILESGEDCKELVGRNPSVELLELLRDIALAGLPIAGFCDCESSVAGLRNKYNGMSETIDLRLEEYKSLGIAPRLMAKRLAFKFRDFSHVLVEKSLIELELIDGAYGKYDVMASQLLASGIIQPKIALLSWIEIPQEVKSEILKFYKYPGIVLCGMEWDIYLEQNKNKIFHLMYLPGGRYYLVFSQFRVGVDYNSITIDTIVGTQLWRAVLVNEKIYSYCNNDVAGLL